MVIYDVYDSDNIYSAQSKWMYFFLIIYYKSWCAPYFLSIWSYYSLSYSWMKIKVSLSDRKPKKRILSQCSSATVRHSTLASIECALN